MNKEQEACLLMSVVNISHCLNVLTVMSIMNSPISSEEKATMIKEHEAAIGQAQNLINELYKGDIEG